MDDFNVMPYTQETTTVVQSDDSLLTFDNIVDVANKAEERLDALNKIMENSLKITTARDWVLIGGVPYLQESGATKVARLFGVGWRILPGYPQQRIDSDGYPTFIYRMQFSLNGGQSIEAEGMRNARDEFFAGKKGQTGKNAKSADEIDFADVQRAAYTNCINRGIKSLLPGLRNIDVETLERAGINLNQASGYTFKTGSKGGNTQKAEDSGIVCEECGAAVSQKVASYAQSKFGRVLCMKCQKTAAAAPEGAERA